MVKLTSNLLSLITVVIVVAFAPAANASSKQGGKSLMIQPPIKKSLLSAKDNKSVYYYDEDIYGPINDFYNEVRWNMSGPTVTLKIDSLTLTGSSNMSIVADNCGSATHPGSPGCSYTIRYKAQSLALENAVLTIVATTDNGSVTVTTTYVITLHLRGYVNTPKQAKIKCGSIVNIDNQTIAERIPLTGTQFALYYSSEYATDFIGKDLATTNSFHTDGITISAQHFYDSSKKKLYLGTGNALSADSQILTGGNLLVVHPSGNEVYVFDPSGRHLETKSSLMGTTKFTFGYNGSGYLTSITDDYSNNVVKS